MSTPHPSAWGARLRQLLFLYAEHAQEYRDPPIACDAYAAMDMRPDEFARARRALLDDGRLRPAPEAKRQGQIKGFVMTAAGWASINQTPPKPSSTGPAVRKCLCCNARFNSTSSGNRICPRCRVSGPFRGGSLAW